MTKIFNKNIYRLFFLVIVYKIILDITYVQCVYPLREYAGYILNFDLLKYIISNFIVLLSIFPLNKLFNNFNKPSTIILIILFFIYFYPLCTISSFAGFSDIFFYFSLSYWFILIYSYLYSYSFSLNKNTNSIINNNIHRKKEPDKIYFYLLFWVVILLSLFMTIYYNGFKIKLNLLDVYDLRIQAKDMDVIGIYGYIKPLASMFCIIGIIYYLLKNNITISIILVIVQLSFFAFGANKTDFFNLLFSIIIFFFYKNKYKYFIVYGVILIQLIVLLSQDFNNETYSFSSLILARVFYAPSLISSQYFDFFSTHEFLYFRESIFSKIGIANPYGDNIKYIIGRLYWNEGNSANTGLIGNDFAQLGWFSLFLMPFLRVLILRLIDYCSKGLNIRIILLLSISYAIIFTNISFTASLLTNGLLFVCLLLYLMPRNYNKL